MTIRANDISIDTLFNKFDNSKDKALQLEEFT